MLGLAAPKLAGLPIGFHSFRMHLTMTGAVAASLALVVVLILALDWPFRGEVSISPDPAMSAVAKNRRSRQSRTGRSAPYRATISAGSGSRHFFATLPLGPGFPGTCLG
jgi:hypothetical protein